jgi:hypothetical protein
MFTKLALAAALVGASLPLPAAAQPDVSPVDVTSRAPTAVRVSIVGKQKAAVRTEVRAAARFVCRNAIGNHELAIGDFRWCSDGASYKAMRRYAAITQGRGFADSGVILLSAR